MDQTSWNRLRSELENRLPAADGKESQLLTQLDELWTEHLKIKRELAELRASAVRMRAEGVMSTRLRDALRE